MFLLKQEHKTIHGQRTGWFGGARNWPRQTGMTSGWIAAIVDLYGDDWYRATLCTCETAAVCMQKCAREHTNNYLVHSVNLFAVHGESGDVQII